MYNDQVHSLLFPDNVSSIMQMASIIMEPEHEGGPTKTQCEKQSPSQDERTVPKTPKKSTAESEKTFRAVATGNFRQLDPVSGDASCEMRVPFILDAMDILAMSGSDLESLAPGFVTMYGPDFAMLPADTQSRKGSLPKEGTMPDHYFSLFYPLSVTRQRGVDSLRFIIDDRAETMTYSTVELSRRRSALAQYSVNYMQKIAAFQALKIGDQAPVMEQISRVFQESSIEMCYGRYKQPILPIFEAEYFLSENEYLHGRSIVLVLTRWGYDSKGEQYHYGTQVYMYSPNQAKHIADMAFTLEQTQPDAKIAERGVTVIHAFNIFPLEQVERNQYEDKACFTNEEKFFNSPDNTKFEKGFTKCDLGHLLRIWGAAHPPAHSSAVAKGFKPGQSRLYMEEKHHANLSRSTPQNYRLTSNISLFGGKDTNISDEYFAYKMLVDRCGITNIRYASEGEETPKKFYVAPYGCAGEKTPLKEWSTMSAPEFCKLTNASGAKAQRDRITYIPKLYTRACQPIPFSICHCFVSNYDTEQRYAKELNKRVPVNRKFAQEISMELISGTYFGRKKGRTIKKQLAFWTVKETIDGEHQTSIQYPDSKTELGYETVETPEERRVLANRMIEIARTLSTVNDIAAEVIERAKEIVESKDMDK